MSLKELIFTSIFFILVTLIFFHKIFFGLIPLPTDLIVGSYYPWLDSKWGYSVGVPVKNPKLSDSVSIFYPLKALAVDFEKKGELPLWNPYMFGGYPLFASVQLGLLFPTMIFYLLFSTPIAWTLQVMSQPLLASVFMYLLLRHFQLDKLPSLFGGIAYGFGGFTILWMQWNTHATTSMFLPILLLLEDKYITSRQLKWGILLSIFICFQILAGYLPIIPFTLITLVIWYFFRTINLKLGLKIGLLIILGVLLSAVISLPIAELTQNSQRKVETLGSTSPFNPPENFINLIAPDFFGNDATGNFWGRGDHMDATLYVGATTLILALIGIQKFFKKTPVKFASCLFAVALVLVVSNPLSIFLYKLGLWGGLSITMNRANFMMNLSLAILGAYGLSQLKNSYSKLSLRPSIWIALIFLGVALGLFICRETLIKGLAGVSIKSDAHFWLANINVALRNLILPAGLVTTVFSLIIFIKKFRPTYLVVQLVFILILILELFRFGWKFNTFSSPSFLYPQTPISEFLQNYPNDRFVAEKDIFPANMWVPFKLSSIAGYDGIYPVNSAKLLAVANSGDISVAPQPRWGILANFNSKLIDETNSRFVLAVKRNDDGEISSSGQVDYRLRVPKFEKVFEDKSIFILENKQNLPRVYLTRKVIKASDNEILKLMLDDNFPIRTTSLTNNFEFNSPSNEVLDARLTYNQLTNSRVLITASSNLDAYLVVLDTFYPGWKAQIDGTETKIYRTNYNFRGIILPKGNHTVEFIYDPKSLKYGALISGFSLILVVVLIMYSKFSKRFKEV